MMTILDTQCYPVLAKNFALTNVSIEKAVSKRVEDAISQFYTVAKKSLMQALENGNDISTVKVPIMTTNLTMEEREEFEDLLSVHGHWSVFCGDHFVTVFTPTYGLKDPQAVQITYLTKSGKFCPTCSVFTEYHEVESRWVCPSCGRYVGCYQNSAIAMGQVAKSSERKHRMYTHGLIDRLWKEGLLQRKEVYRELSEVLNIPRQYTHIAMLDDKVLPIVNAWANARYQQKLEESKGEKK